MENIENVLNSNQYARLRIGISSPKDSFNQIDFVLGKFNNDEYDLLSSDFLKIDELVTSFVHSGVDPTMNNFNN